MLRLPDRGQVLVVLRTVAISEHPIAFLAVSYLGRDTGPQGLTILHELYLQSAVKESLALKELLSIANYQKW